MLMARSLATMKSRSKVFKSCNTLFLWRSVVSKIIELTSFSEEPAKSFQKSFLNALIIELEPVNDDTQFTL